MYNAAQITLKQFIKNYKDKNGLIEENIIKDILKKISKKMIEVHNMKKIIKNLTPNNILINEKNKIKVQNTNNDNIMIGDVDYISLEGELDNYDIYSFGCIIYELCTLNEYNTNEEKDCKINTEKYNKKWQELINSILIQKYYYKRPKIENIYYKYINPYEIKLKLKIDKNDINKNIYHTYNTKEQNNNIDVLNSELYINNVKYKYQNFNIYKKEETYQIKIIFYFNMYDFKYLFYNCYNLKIIDLSSCDTFNISNMSYMFKGCINLENINLLSLDTNNVINMAYMFCDCYNLKNIDLSSFNTDKVTDMSYMFKGCRSLEKINLSFFNTKNVENMEHMFSYCNNIKNIDINSFNTNNVKNMSNMFYHCINLENINLSSFNFNKAIDLSYMFCDCINLKNIILPDSSMPSSKCLLFGIFYNCNNLIKMNISQDFGDKVKKNNPYFEFGKLTEQNLN